jgi:hypothetical protein
MLTGLVLLLTGMLWMTGAIMHWYTIRRQEKLVARLRRISAPRAPGPASAQSTAAVPEVFQVPEPAVEHLRPSKRWTVG